MKTYNSDTTEYLHTHEAGAMVPLRQAIFTGVLFGLIMLVFMLKFRVIDGWLWAIVGGLIVTLIVWIILLSHIISLDTLERWTGLNLDGDDEEPEPEEKVVPVRIDLQEFDRSGNPTHTVYARFANEKRMIQLAKHLLEDKKPFSEPALVGRGKLLSPTEYKDIKEEMLKRGMLIQRHPREPKQGCELTRAGAAALRDLLR